MKVRKLLGLLTLSAMVTAAAAGCGSNNSQNAPAATEAAKDNNKAITVVSREDGSGTRGAFIELFKIEESVL